MSAARSHDFRDIEVLNSNLSASFEISVILIGRSGRDHAVFIFADAVVGSLVSWTVCACQLQVKQDLGTAVHVLRRGTGQWQDIVRN